jgi:predicted glycoside hydrolase/deacetylase ChbG (UPF0249 family)
MSETRLVVQADDFGMCHAVNRGIVRAVTEGIATQSVLMAPCGWFDEAIALSIEHSIPVGMHCTLTSEWEHLRWRPMTEGATLRASDGGFWRSVEEVQAHADPDEACAELDAQFDRLDRAGVRPMHLDCHMGATCMPAFQHLCDRSGLRFLYPLAKPCYPFESVSFLSHHPPDRKREWLLGYLDGLAPGTHFLCTHPGEGGGELRALTQRDAENVDWTERNRVGDLEVLCDPEIRRRVEQRGIALTSVAAL